MASLQLAFDILAKDNASKVFNDVGDSAEKAGDRGKKFGLLLGGAAVAGAAGLFAVLKGGAAEFSDNQTAMAQFEAGLKSTGNVAGITAGEMKTLADSIEAKTGTDGASVVAGGALLATFTKVRNEVGEGNAVFDRATQAGVDLAAKGFGSVESNAVLLGKALNDPVKGLAALGKQGVTFTAEQKKTIGALVETGDTLGAQKIILAEIEGQVGGSAAAYGQTLPGQLARARAAFDGVKETIFTAVLPAVAGLLEFVSAKLIPGFQSLADKVGPTFSTIGNVLQTVVIPAVMTAGQAIAGFISAIPLPVLVGIGAAIAVFGGALLVSAAATAIQTGAVAALNAVLLLNPIGIVIALLVGLVAGLVFAYRESETFRDIVDGAFTKVKDAGQAVADFVTKTIPEAFTAVKDAVSGAVTATLDAVTGAWDSVKTKTTDAFNAVKTTVTDAWFAVKTTISDALTAAVEFVAALPGRFLDALSSLGSTLRGAASSAWTAFQEAAAGVVAGAIEFVTGIPGRIVTALAPLAANLLAAAAGAWAEFQGAIDGGVGSTLAYVAGIPGKIVSALGNLGSLLLGVGGDIVAGLARGIRNGVGNISAALLSLIPGPLKKFAGALGIASPSKVFMGFGENIGQGLALGIDGTRPLVAGSAVGLANAALTPGLSSSFDTTGMGGAGFGDKLDRIEAAILGDARRMQKKDRQMVGAA